MPATTETITSLPPLQRRMAEAWLTRFEEDWHEQKLNECMRALPAQSSLRRPLLIAMIQRDLAHHWDTGNPSVIETYLKEFPELGGIDDIPVDLIAAEYNARKKHNRSDLADFAERFPTRIDDLYLLLKPGLFEAGAPIDRAAINDSMSVQRLKLLRAPADQEAVDPVSEQRQKLVRSAVPGNPPPVEAASETIQDGMPSSNHATDSDIFSPPPEPARANSPPKPEAATEDAVWPDIQTVRSNHALSKTALPKPATEAPPMPPHTLGRYLIEKRLGGSGFGSTYQATDTQLNRRVALKIPQFSGPEAATIRARFQREGRAAAGLCHPFLCPVLDVGQIDGVDFLAMSYVEGDSLADVLKQRPIWPAKQAANLILKLAIALDAAHRQGVVHRDLKPSNILIAPSETPVVVGFGQSTEPLHSQRTANAVYVAPEQSVTGTEAAGPRSDIYSLGVILHQLLTSKLPHSNSGVSPFPTDIDQQLQNICRKATALKPEQRFGTMRELITELTEYRQRVQPSEGEVRLPMGGTAPRQNPAAVPTMKLPDGLSGTPSNSAGSRPATTPASSNGTFARIQELRNLSAAAASPLPLARLGTLGRLQPRHWRLIAACIVGGIALLLTLFALARMHKPQNSQGNEQDQGNQPSGSAGQVSIQMLADDLSSSNLKTRMAAIEQLKSRKGLESVEALTQFIVSGPWLVSDPKGTDRSQALAAIRELDKRKVNAAIKRAYGSTDRRIRNWAVGEIAALANSEFKDGLLPLLISALSSGNSELRLVAAEKIKEEKVTSSAVVRALVDRIKDDQWDGPIRRATSNGVETEPETDEGKNAALEALREVAPQKVKSALESAARSSNLNIRRWALEQLKE